MSQFTRTAAGSDSFRLLALGTLNPGVVKGSAGRVVGWHITNVSAAVRYVKLYDQAAAPTVGTTVPFVVIALPAGGVSALTVPDGGFSFLNGLGIGTTVGQADNDVAAVTAGDLVVNLFFR